MRFDGCDVTGRPAAQRGVGFVFQQYALFRHMTVAKNIAFGMDVKPRRDRPGRRERGEKVERLLALVELEGLGGRYPTQLSGGQRQRVALARALAVEPRVLLLDEPFGALDATVRKSLRRELRRIHDATGVTTVFVTHDQDEALDLADRVAVLNGGRIEQLGPPREILERPGSAFVAGFVGQANRLEGEVRDGVFTACGITLPAPDTRHGPAVAFIRPDQLAPATASEPALQVRLDRLTARGPVLWLECTAPDGRSLEAATPRSESVELPEPGGWVRLAARGGKVFTAA